MELTIWIADDDSGDFFFEGEWDSEHSTREAVILPARRVAIEPSLWEAFEKQWEETQRPFAEREGREYVPPGFYPRRFVREALTIPIRTEDFPAYTGLLSELEIPRLLRWKAVHVLSHRQDWICKACGEGCLAPDRLRFRCLQCEHGPSDWQARFSETGRRESTTDG